MRPMTALMIAAWAAFAAPAAAAGRPAPLGWLGDVRWVNHAALTPDSLRGRVVVVSFWTFACINCRRTLPALRALAQRWPTGDVRLVGVHTPELPIEYETPAVVKAVHDLGVTWPAAQDNRYTAWNAFGNEAWPALYVIDRAGRVRDVHIGELHEGTPAWRRITGTIETLRRERG